MDNPKTLDLVKELAVHLLSTHSPSPSVDPSTIAAADLPVAGGHGRPPPTFPSPMAMDDPKTLDLAKELIVHLLSTRSPSPSVDLSATATANLPIASGHGRPQESKTLDLVKELVVHLFSTRSASPSVDPSATATATADLLHALRYAHRLTEPWSTSGRGKDQKGSGSQPDFIGFRGSRSNRTG